jgi:hypothetical protein
MVDTSTWPIPGSQRRLCNPQAYSQLLTGEHEILKYAHNFLDFSSEQAIMARDLMEAKEELRKLRETRDENVRLLSDAKFSLIRSGQLQSSTISDCLVRQPVNSSYQICDRCQL